MRGILRTSVLLAAASFMVAASGSAALAQRLFFKPLVLDGGKVKWKSTALATGARITFAFATRSIATPGAHNCRDIGPLDSLAGPRASLDQRAIRGALAAALDRWERVADIHFVEIADENSADIVIGRQSSPTGRAFANVETRGVVDKGVKEIGRSLVCLNAAQPWKIGFDGNLEVYDLVHTFTHEIGHAIGLDHPGGAGSLMSPRYDERVADLGAGDIAGAVALYGPSRAIQRANLGSTLQRDGARGSE